MLILGVNAFHGDASAAIIRDGQLVCAVEEERFNRVKHSAGIPALAIQECLREAGASLADVDHVAVSRDPRAHLVDKAWYVATHPRLGLRAAADRARNAVRIGGLATTLEQALHVDDGTLRGRVRFVEHHRAHVASAYFVSPFEDAAVLSLDGFGDFVSASWGTGRGPSFETMGRVMYPHSLGVVYTAVSQWLGFTSYGDEGKVMGLAAYGRPTYLQRFDRLGRTAGLGYKLDLSFFDHHRLGITMTWASGTPVLERLYSQRFVELFGAPLRPEQWGSEEAQDVAASLQAWLENAVLGLMRTLRSRTGRRALAYAGGVALNSVANGLIRDRTGFDDVFIQPAAGDNGTSVGAAYHVWHQLLGQPRGFVMEHAYTGTAFGDDEIRDALVRAGLLADGSGVSVELLTRDAMIARSAEAIADGRIVGFFQGRMEFGPRALGARSILVDPRRADMKAILNSRIKHREPFRPFAPSILEEHTGEYFERSYPSPAMLMVYQVRPHKRPVIPAVTHVDGSGRLQTVSRRTSPTYWQLIEAFRVRTGVPLVLNTSFNENEPIVRTPDEAIDCFLRTRMDVLVLENWYVTRRAS